MLTRPKTLTSFRLHAVIGAMLLGPACARADILHAHVGVGYAPYDSLGGVYDTGPTFAEAEGPLATVQVDGPLTSSAYARAQLNANSLLATSATSYYPGGTGLFQGPAGAGAFAAWADVAYYQGGSPPPALQLNFKIEGTVSSGTFPGPDGGPPPGFPTNVGRVTIIAIDLITHPVTGLPMYDYLTLPENVYGNSLSPGTFEFNAPSLGQSVHNSSYAWADSANDNSGTRIEAGGPGLAAGWSIESIPGSDTGFFTGTFQLTTSYDPTLGGYPWTVAMHSLASTAGGQASSDFVNTASLTSITLPDGTPVQVAFDSGLTLGGPSAVPEPASLALLGMGLAGLGGYVWRRRRRAAPAAC